MSLKLLLFAFALLLIATIGCRKDDTNFDAFFWTSVDTSQTRLTLIIDGVPAGLLPFLPSEPSCGDDRTFHTQLHAGKHTFEARDLNGTLRSLHTVKFTQRKSSSKGTVGGLRIQMNDNCIVVGLFY